jgi:hypothetical protein
VVIDRRAPDQHGSTHALFRGTPGEGGLAVHVSKETQKLSHSFYKRKTS